MKILFAALMSLCLLPFSAAAETASRGEILGSWTFETAIYRGGQCKMTGQLALTLTETPGHYGCELMAAEECVSLGRSLVQQSCKATRIGNRVSIDSSVEQFLERKSGYFAYYPDNFELLVLSDVLMKGQLVSAVTAPATFRRIIQGIS